MLIINRTTTGNLATAHQGPHGAHHQILGIGRQCFNLNSGFYQKPSITNFSVRFHKPYSVWLNLMEHLISFQFFISLN